MKTNNPSLAENPIWKKLIRSSIGVLGRHRSFYDKPEPELYSDLLLGYPDDLEALVRETLDLIRLESQKGGVRADSWATLKVGATLLHHLNITGRYTPGDAWENVAKILWDALGEFVYEKWSDLPKQKNSNKLPPVWGQKKFVVDTFIEVISRLPRSDADRIENFFNCKLNDDWKSFIILWPKIWGLDKNDLETYFEKGGFRNNYKLATYLYLANRLQEFDSDFYLSRPDKPKEAFDYFGKYPERIPADGKTRRIIYLALFKYLREDGVVHTMEEDLAAIRNILGDDDVFGFLTNHKELSPADRGMLYLSFGDAYLEERWEVSEKYKDKTLPDLLAAVKHDGQSVRGEAQSFLRSHETDVFKYLYYKENQEQDGKGENTTDIFKKIARIFRGDTAEKLYNNISFTAQQKGKFLLATPRLLEARWRADESPNHDDLLPIILATVNSDDATVGAKASSFLKRQSKAIQEQLDKLINDLDQEDKAGEMAACAIEFGTETALKAILGKCVIWVASENKGTLVDQVAQKARHAPGAVLALINLLNNHNSLHKEIEVREYVRAKVLEEQQNPTIKRVFKFESPGSEETKAKQAKTNGQSQAGEEMKEDKKLNGKKTTENEKLSEEEMRDGYTVPEIYKWCYSLKKRSKAYADLMASQEEVIRRADRSLIPKHTFDLAKSMLKLLMEEKFSEREIAVQKWITQLLSEMSDRWFFKDEKVIYKKIKSQLERLAVEPLSRRLPKEENLDIRENLVKILGNIGGRIAVDALVRTVTGEERERAASQELLSEYYLKPSKARSEEAAILLTDAVDNAKKTMRLLQNLNLATFVMGAVLIIGGVTISVVSEELGSRIVGVLAGLGGLAAILTQFLKDPLERIQRAMADLVQVQTAFTSFVWELNLNGTYIQSQYVSEGVLTDFDLRQTIGRIDHAMERTMHLIHVYADGQSVNMPPQLHYLVPSSDGTSGSFAVFGQALSGRSTKKGNSKVQIAINHQPVEAVIELSTDQMVMLSLSEEVLGKYRDKKRLWVSLFIDGVETNALPFEANIASKKIPPKSQNGQAKKEAPVKKVSSEKAT